MALEERTREKIKNAFGGMDSYAKLSTSNAKELVQRHGQTLADKKAKEGGGKKESTYVPPRHTQERKPLYDPNRKKKIDVDNSTGRPLKIPFSDTGGHVSCASFKAPPRITMTEEYVNRVERFNDEMKDIEVNRACNKHLKHMQHEIYDKVGDDETRL